MIKLKITSLWEKKAWINGKYLREARDTGQDIFITLKIRDQEEETMHIENEKIHPEKWAKSEKEYRDRFGGQMYKLWGIEFVPDQQRLI